ncbi:uncharacterized protein LOC103310587 [Acyrthosiphon pisum]|uniref:ACYPI008667 protein n=1 Tax=Acyrthosiphon pisum TaxID=7029 RepID=I6QAK3_ACYPI|nr:uncharacterized protein LOC103310587 [Acyrthosiphon pisum]AFK66765.1 hypothetical protein [Acyrthosiphon pisum]|eukprot:NP_001288152.1 uncharacterized protein LOC103310587 [Acyrthosiphon pisum]
MFLLDAAVPVIAFFLLFNFLYLYSPIESMESGWIFKTCDACLQSTCHTENKRPCYTRWNVDYNFTCFMCPPEFGNDQYFYEDECLKGCTDEKKHCVCDFWCYMCVAKEGFDKANFTQCIVDPNEEINCK